MSISISDLEAKMRLLGEKRYEAIHQPRMKVFTVGLDEKEKAKQADIAKTHETKSETKVDLDNASPISTISSPAPTIIIPRGPPQRKYRTVCGLWAWLVTAFFLVLLCLAISEIAYNRQRDSAFLRLKWAELRQRMLGYELLSRARQEEQNAYNQDKFTFHSGVETLPLKSEETATANSVEVKHEDEQPKDSRLSFLESILNKIREKAHEAGINTDQMKVQVIEVKPFNVEDGRFDQAIADGFGEFAAPRQIFNNQPEEMNAPVPFPLFGSAPAPFASPLPPPPSSDSPFSFPSFNPYRNNFFNRLPNRMFIERPDYFISEQGAMGPQFYDYNSESPQMRITHHFGRNPNQPQRIVTELYGQQSPEMYRSIFSGMPFGQQQASAFGSENWGNTDNNNNFMMQRPMNDFPRFPSAFQPQQPNQQLGFNFQAQNQPLNLQWNGEQNTNSLPWYMSGDTNSNTKVDTPFQPHPSFSSNALPSEPVYWVDNTAVKDSQGSDGFEKKEQVNLPAVDEITEEPSEVVPVDDKWKVNAWQHTVTANNDDTANAVPAAAVNSDSSLNTNSLDEENTFLPIRITQDKNNDAPISDDLRSSPFFQIDDPSSYKH